MPKVSVIIPCYNQGVYINETVDSVLNQTEQDFEIIIVNDGSTDVKTIEILNSYKKPKTRLIHTENQGPSAARNLAIKEAKGKYILPLDGDDLIGDSYLEKATHVLDTNDQVGIVYCLADKFGEEEGFWELEEYSLKGILIKNMIFCTGMYRKEDFLLTAGYDVNMRKGSEDWDFWLSLLELGVDVYRIPEVLFYYRILKNSRSNSIQKTDWDRIHQQIYSNHFALYFKTLGSPIKLHRDFEKIQIKNKELERQLEKFNSFIMVKIIKYLWNLKRKIFL